MSGDYKYAAQLRAEEAAEELGLDYFLLPMEARCELYQQGLDDYAESRLAEADGRRKREREEGRA